MIAVKNKNTLCHSSDKLCWIMSHASVGCSDPVSSLLSKSIPQDFLDLQAPQPQAMLAQVTSLQIIILHTAPSRVARLLHKTLCKHTLKWKCSTFTGHSTVWLNIRGCQKVNVQHGPQYCIHCLSLSNLITWKWTNKIIHTEYSAFPCQFSISITPCP